MKNSLIKGADLLKQAGVKLVVPNNAPVDIKNLVQDMDMGISETASSGSTLILSRGASGCPSGKEQDHYFTMEDVQILDSVFKNFSVTHNQ